VIDGMQRVVESGTAAKSRIPGIIMCGKTGTAQKLGKKDNSVFVAFAPRDNPKIAIAVVVEEAGQGANWAAPIASYMVEKYLRDTITARPSLNGPEWFMEQHIMTELKAKTPVNPTATDTNKKPAIVPAAQKPLKSAANHPKNPKLAYMPATLKRKEYSNE